MHNRHIASSNMNFMLSVVIMVQERRENLSDTLKRLIVRYYIGLWNDISSKGMLGSNKEIR